MSSYPHPIIAREGWPFIALALVVALALSFARLAWLAVIFCVQFFRDPARVVPTQANVVLCPADGRVVKVGAARDAFLDRDALLVSDLMNLFNVHSNRSPVDGEVVAVWYHAGAFVNAALDKASTQNERNAMHLRTAAGADVYLPASARARVAIGDKVRATETIVAELG